MEERKILTANEAAEYLRVKPRTIYKWIKDGELKSYKIGEGRDIRLPMETILDYLKRHESENANEC